MEMGAGPGCVQPDVALLAEFRGWLDRERGLSLVSVRCYSKPGTRSPEAAGAG